MSTAIVTTVDTEKDAKFREMLESATPEIRALLKDMLTFAIENDVAELDKETLNDRFLKWRVARYEEQCERRHEEARAVYKQYQDNISKLDKKGKELFDRVGAFKTPDRYDMRCDEILMVASVYENNAVDASNIFFKYGFIKGMRYAKKQLKREMQRA